MIRHAVGVGALGVAMRSAAKTLWHNILGTSGDQVPSFPSYGLPLPFLRHRVTGLIEHITTHTYSSICTVPLPL